MASLARRHPSIHFLTVSPGGTSGTQIFSFLGFIGSCLSFLLSFTGQMHTVDVGAKRYVSALQASEACHAKNGAFIASREGQIGPVGDQAELWALFDDHDAQDAAFDAIHRFMA